EIEREKYGDTTANLGLFGGAAAPAPVQSSPAGQTSPAGEESEGLTPAPGDDDAFNDAVAAVIDGGAAETTQFAAHAAAFHETPVTPELNALEILPLDGIREKKVREIALEVRYADMNEERVRRIREICEDNQGEIPLSVTIVDVPEALGGSSVRIRVNQHFRVQPSPTLASALEAALAKPQYVFPKG
ncbi:MAG: hypothetical protein JWO56_370, partial [Acidobacteria bacterium]|nr:hypothetical protein [Acidobacteriota bacterium]